MRSARLSLRFVEGRSFRRSQMRSRRRKESVATRRRGAHVQLCWAGKGASTHPFQTMQKWNKWCWCCKGKPCHHVDQDKCILKHTRVASVWHPCNPCSGTCTKMRMRVFLQDNASIDLQQDTLHKVQHVQRSSCGNAMRHGNHLSTSSNAMRTYDWYFPSLHRRQSKRIVVKVHGLLSGEGPSLAMDRRRMRYDRPQTNACCAIA